MDLARHQMSQSRLFCKKKAGDAAFRPTAAFAASDRERTVGQLRDGGGRSERSGQSGEHNPGVLRHGQAMIAVLAILNPKLAPGERLVKNDSESFDLSPGSSGLALATEAEQPAGADTSVIGDLSSYSKSMKYSGSATRSVTNLDSDAGFLLGQRRELLAFDKLTRLREPLSRE
jgi:hypothetical protein